MSSYSDFILLAQPIGYWRTGESVGPNAADSSGNGLTGTYQNNPTLGNTGAILGGTDTCVLLSQSTSQYISVPDSPLLAFGDNFSLEFWWNFFSGGGSTRGLFDKGVGGLEVRVSGGNLQLLKNGSGVLAQTVGAGIANGSWRHYVITKSGSQINIYVNGVDRTDPASLANQTIANTSNALAVGGDPTASAYPNGFMDEIAVYNYPLAAYTVRSHYQKGIGTYMAGQDRARPALGLLIKRGNGASPETFTAIAEVKDINGPNLKVTTQDSTHLADTWKGIKTILLEGGDVKLVCNFLLDDATQSMSSGLLLDLVNKSLRNFQIIWPDGAGGVLATWPLAAYVTGFVPKGSVTSLLTADVTLSIDGTPAFV